MAKKNFIKDLIEKLEYYLPMSFGSFVLFLFTIYAFVVVGRSIWTNYNSNKSIEAEQVTVDQMRQEIVDLQNEINYEQTADFKEKEARQKLNYIAPGEKMVALPYDKDSSAPAETVLGEVPLKTPNYYLWWKFLMEDN